MLSHVRYIYRPLLTGEEPELKEVSNLRMATLECVLFLHHGASRTLDPGQRAKPGARGGTAECMGMGRKPVRPEQRPCEGCGKAGGVLW